MLLLSLVDPTFQPTVGKSVALVELKVAFVGEKAPTGFWYDVFDSIGGNDCGREVDEVLPPCL